MQLVLQAASSKAAGRFIGRSGASGSKLPSNGTKGGSVAVAAGSNPDIVGYAPVNVSAAAGTTVTFSAQKPAVRTQR